MELSGMIRAPAFHVGGIPIYGDLILAPMDGISDPPFRLFTRRMGSAMSYTEFINAIDVVGESRFLKRRIAFSEGERPVVFQILDDDLERMIKAALRLREENPDILDVNLGCSARTVTSRGAGAALLRDPKKIGLIFKKLTAALDIPVTGKIRLGWDEANRNYLEIAHIIEDNGGSLLAVHARTKVQRYEEKVDWEAIAEIKHALKIPVIGNGNVSSVAQIDAIKSVTGCDGVMIGRASLGNPWIFSRRDRGQVPSSEVHETMVYHLEQLIAFYGEFEGMLKFRKFAKRYLAPYPIEREDLVFLLTESSSKVFFEKLQTIFKDW
jgi:tRNA-dihydrouridine synthase B